MVEKSKFSNFSYFFLLTLFIGLIALTILNMSGVDGTLSFIIIIWFIILAFVWYFFTYSKFPLFQPSTNYYSEFDQENVEFCLKCSAKVEIGQTICHECGAKLVK